MHCRSRDTIYHVIIRTEGIVRDRDGAGWCVSRGGDGVVMGAVGWVGRAQGGIWGGLWAGG